MAVPGWRVPSPDTILGNLLRREYERVQTAVENQRERNIKYGLCLLSDSATDTNHQSVLNFVVASANKLSVLGLENCFGVTKSKEFVTGKIFDYIRVRVRV